MTAPAVVKQLKIQSQKDTKQLAEAKEIAYKEGFYNGTMIIGEFKGESVQDAKPKVREAMIKAGLAFPYAEPEGLVISRSADECVVAIMDQWYLDYGEPSWRAQTEGYVRLSFKKINTQLINLASQSVGENEYIFIRDSTRISEDFGLVE
jgi:leucyl-tRNA synthetase